MKAGFIVAVLTIASATQAQQQDAQTTNQQHSAMMERGDKGMGFSQEKTTHHFMLLKTGGEIQVTVNDVSDTANLEHIRMHLSHVARMFSAGDFDIPMFVHNTTLPGVPIMKKLHTQIQYSYRELESGGKITISTANPRALEAVHKFLRFQITDHQTGDSTDVER